MIEKLRLGLLNALVPLTKQVGHIHTPWSHKLITGKDYLQAKDQLRAGMVLISNTAGEFSNVLIPGFWSHAALVADSEYVYEAVGKGVLRTDLVSFLTAKDYAICVEPVFASASQREAAVKWAASMEGMPYDYDFMSGNKGFYCAELVWAAYQSACGKDVPFTLRKVLGVDTVIPQDFDNAKDKWRPVWESPSYTALKKGA